MENLLKFSKIVKWNEAKKKFTYNENELKTLNEDLFTKSIDRSIEHS